MVDGKHKGCNGSRMVRVYVFAQNRRAFICYASPVNFLNELNQLVKAVEPLAVFATFGLLSDGGVGWGWESYAGAAREQVAA